MTEAQSLFGGKMALRKRLLTFIIFLPLAYPITLKKSRTHYFTHILRGRGVETTVTKRFFPLSLIAV